MFRNCLSKCNSCEKWGAKAVLRRLLVAELTIAVLALVACDARTSVRGFVVDESGKPVVGASITLTRVGTGETTTTLSAEDGSFLVGITHGPWAGQFEIVVSKPGFRTFRQAVEANTRINVRVVLHAGADS